MPPGSEQRIGGNAGQAGQVERSFAALCIEFCGVSQARNAWTRQASPRGYCEPGGVTVAALHHQMVAERPRS